MRLSLLLMAAFALALTGCVYPPANIIPEPPGQCEVDGVPVAGALMFATERMPTCAERLKVTDRRGSRIMYGAVDRGGMVHFYHPDRWWAELRNRMNGGQAPLLFVHGYNNSNKDALATAFAIRAAVGAGHEVIALTWPSYAQMKKYTWDEANAVWAAADTRAVITALAATGRPITIVAHSMGNRITLDALMLISEQARRSAIRRLVMASADVDRATAISHVPALGIPVTVYGSTRDQALSASWREHGLPRAGDLSTWFTGHKPDFAFANSSNVDVVDTSAVTRGVVHHTDYITTPEGAADLCRVVNGKNPEQGRYLDPRGSHWLLARAKDRPLKDQCANNVTAAQIRRVPR